ncbi:hypothetical protein MKZ38_008811 [Zalerion maritima]|uniref:Uncharacterized protein n=1 Tax=Zalerion maritima TaxID=339359 RepID=A0AAD5WMB1_9PEZI|nr:hypothetical protein MKZ38_008811 [Zalerion maritima]
MRLFGLCSTTGFFITNPIYITGGQVDSRQFLSSRASTARGGRMGSFACRGVDWLGVVDFDIERIKKAEKASLD